MEILDKTKLNIKLGSFLKLQISLRNLEIQKNLIINLKFENIWKNFEFLLVFDFETLNIKKKKKNSLKLRQFENQGKIGRKNWKFS